MLTLKAKQYYQVSADPHAYEDRPYRKVMGKSGKAWFYRPGKFAATHIYVDGGKGSQGMGGRTITFKLEDGTTYDSIGPWMTGADAMFKDTGVDVRHQNGTRLVLARQVEYPKDYYAMMPDMIDVVHHEPEFVEGHYDRARELAQKIVNDLNEPLHYFIESFGGAQSGLLKPEAK